MKSAIAALAAFVCLGPWAHAGVLVGNGGDSVYCKKTSEIGKFPYTGFYVLDYALTFPAPDHFRKVDSLSGSLDRIQNLLRLKAPQALPSFLSFRATLDPAPFVATADRHWVSEGRPLTNIRDEEARSLPANCRFKNFNRSYYGIYQQTVIRRKVHERVVYRYDAAIMNDYLSRTNATQISILLVHEWLWDFYEADRYGAPKIRNANLFLHSEAAESAGPEEFFRQVFRAQN